MIRPVSISVGIHGLLICLLCIQIGHSYRAIPVAVQRQQPARVVHRFGHQTGRSAHQTYHGRADRPTTRPAQLAAKNRKQTVPAVPHKNSPRSKKHPPEKKQPATQKQAAKQPVSGKPVSGKPVSGKPVSEKAVATKSVSGQPVAEKPVSARGNDAPTQAAPPQPPQNPVAPQPELAPVVTQEICKSDSDGTQGGTEPLDRMRGALTAAWRPPRGIRPTRPCIIRIRMRDGAALSSPVVVQSSGIPAFDMSAQRALLAASCSHLRGVYEFEFVFAP